MVSSASASSKPLQWPVFDQEQLDAVARVLESGRVNYWTGSEGREYEREFAAWCGSKRAIAAANGTVTLEMAIKALGLGPGDEVITTPRTFLASSSSLVIHGIKPVMADVDRDSGNITPETVAPHINSRTKAILPVHLGGWPCDMEGFVDLASSKGIHVIEDCAQAHGAKINGRSVGTYGIINSWSFCQDKIMTTGGEGGMVTCDDEELWSVMWSLKDHGKSWDAVYNRPHPPGFRWLHESWGTNWRMTEMQAAIGRVQLKKLPKWSQERADNAAFYLDALKDHPAFRVPVAPDHMTNAWYRLYAYVKQDALKDGWNRDRILAECLDKGVSIFVGSCSEIYLEKCFQDSGLAPKERLPVAKELGDTSISLVLHPGLPREDMVRIVETLSEAGRSALR